MIYRQLERNTIFKQRSKTMKVREMLENSYGLVVRNDDGTRIVCIEDERKKLIDVIKLTDEEYNGEFTAELLDIIVNKAYTIGVKDGLRD